ncbi:MAG: prepilin peptidase [Desulfobacterales bacterium]|jgi:leader peptidase (prepilin peptidase)/N-methyltransferase
MINVLFVSLVFMFGMCIGSFLNVCIYRLPSSTSIINPSRSFCPQCNSAIQFYDNIPVLSYLWLKGRCRNCKAPISPRYPLVELMTGILAIAILFKFHLTLEGVIYFVFTSSLLVITFIDIDHKIIPDIISLPGIPIGLAASFVLPAMTFKSSLLGLLAGGGSLLLVAWTYSLITRKEGMGGGDIKLLGMIGTFIGWKGVIFTIFAASLTGTLVGMIVMLLKGKNLKFAIPFGPFLSIGAMSYVFFGEKVIFWYFQSFKLL